jgi:hypothetical protein
MKQVCRLRMLLERKAVVKPSERTSMTSSSRSHRRCVSTLRGALVSRAVIHTPMGIRSPLTPPGSGACSIDEDLAQGAVASLTDAGQFCVAAGVERSWDRHRSNRGTIGTPMNDLSNHQVFRAMPSGQKWARESSRHKDSICP